MKLLEFQNAPTTNAPPAAPPATQTKNVPLDPKAKAGAAAVSRALGGKVDVKFAQAIDKAEQGKSLSPTLLKSIAPFAGTLEKIFADPAMRTKFLAMVKSVQAEESVTEDRGGSVDAVASSVTNRIMRQHIDLLSKYGPVKVMAAINDVAEFAGSDELDEIGSSDVSGWVKQVVDGLEAGHFDHVDENAEIDRVRKLAGLPATEGMVDIEYGVDPKMQKLVDIGHLLRKTLDVGSGVKWDDADFNKAANLADALISIGASFGPKNLKDALKLADMDIAQAQELIAKASQRAPDKVGEDSGKSKQYIEIVSVLGHTKRVPVHPVNAYKALNHYRDQPSTKSARIVSEEQPMDEVSNKTLSSYTDKAAKERDAYHADRNKDAESARKYFNRKAGVRKALSVTKENYYTPGPETMPGAVGPQETTTVSFNQSKQMGDATLNINATAKDMDELHRILKLAGVEYDPKGDEQEPDMQVVDAEAPTEEPCGCDDEMPTDVKYSTDKQTLINVLRDKLQKRLA